MRAGLLPFLLTLAATPSLAADPNPYPPEHYVKVEGDPVQGEALRGSIHRDWEGVYIGANAGARFVSDGESDFNNVGDHIASGSFRPGGATLGIHLGYGWEINRLYFGLEGDAEKTFVRGSITTTGVGRTDSVGGIAGSGRVRFGYTFDNLLVYATGGVALMAYRYTDSSALGAEGYSKLPSGWTLGAGVEWAFTKQISGRVEYRYSNFGVLALSSNIAYPGTIERHTVTDQAIRVGLSYRFTGY